MMHPLYQRARWLVGRQIYAHHITGQSYYGTLQSVAPHGIYLLQQRPMARMVSMEQETGVNPLPENIDAELVFAPLAFFGFGFLTGFTVGALATPYYW